MGMRGLTYSWAGIGSINRAKTVDYLTDIGEKVPGFFYCNCAAPAIYLKLGEMWVMLTTHP